MRYREFVPRTKKAAEQLLASGKNEDIIAALIGAVDSIDEWKWLQDRCLEYVNSEDQDVARTAITCLGHIAHFHRSLDVDIVFRRLEQLKSKPHLRAEIDDTIEDIKIFLKLRAYPHRLNGT